MMLKMFSTQLTGLFNRINEKEAFSIEDGARLLAQATVGEGTIYIKGVKEMQAVTALAFEGPEPLAGSKILDQQDELLETDRALIITRFSNDPEAILLAKKLVEQGTPFVAISGKVQTDEEDLSSLADVHIHSGVLKGLIPGEDFERVGFASSMAATYIYYGLKFTIDEILADYR